MTTRLMTRPEVEARTRLSRSTIYKEMREHRFPEPVKIGRAVRWRSDEIDKWLDNLPRATGDLSRNGSTA